jgi:poly(3-hydroxybutyrate) depolymerase
MNAGGMTSTSGSAAGGAMTAGSAGLPASGGTDGAIAGGGGGGGGAGSAGAAGSGSGGGGATRSAGCGKPLGTLKTGSYKITSGGEQRDYTIDIPADYDPERAYRLFYTSHWIGSSDDAVANGQVSNGGAENWGYYGLKRMAKTANEPAIFIAPQSQGSTWTQEDHPLFDDLLAMAKDKLCIDTSRVFATGFSFGAMITYSLSTNHQKDLRGVVAIAPANYNIYLPTDAHEPIAYMSTTGMSDGTCPWDGGNNRGAKYAALGHAMDNGCTIPATIPTAAVGSKMHVCFDFEGCMPGYPVKVCTFDGGHQAAPADGGTSDNGLTSWIPTESWKFFSQF